ncbi:MAG: MFS transporter [Clostridiales bacterium]|nr:MFS transporter [Clostridiales bacterium]
MTGKKEAKLLKDIPAVRWTVLMLLALAIFSAYYFEDILSPLKSLLETSRGWDSLAFGTYAGSVSFFNVFLFFLIFAGIILDKMGVRFTAILAGVVMVAGAAINWYAVTDLFAGTNLENWFNNNLNYIPVFDQLGVSPFYREMPAAAKLASIGFMIFGCGEGMATVAVMRGIVKWFSGKELALASGLEMAIGRLGMATCMIFSPLIARSVIAGKADVSRSVSFGLILLIISLILFIIYFFADKKMDLQVNKAKVKGDPFKIKDIGKIFTSSGFWLIALLCVFFYSAILPFQKYAVNMLECNLNFTPLAMDSFWRTNTAATVQYIVILATAAAAFSSNFWKKKVKNLLLACSFLLLIVVCFMTYAQQSPGAISSVLPLLAMCITPILGNFIDRKGKAVTMLMLGSILLIACHLTFAFILPLLKGYVIGGFIVAYAAILVLGASFSLVPAALWPSVPKLVDKKVLGTAYALIFWIQSIGLWLFPILIGRTLTSSNLDVAEKLNLGLITSDEASVMYNYTNPLIMLACLGGAALILGFVLKITDKKKRIGLELPNLNAPVNADRSVENQPG